jgi:hypothetical protein
MSDRVSAPVLVRGVEDTARRSPAAFAGGAVIGALGGLIGLGGAEFRLPLLIGTFRLAALQAVILNKAMSLVVVASAPAGAGEKIDLGRHGKRAGRGRKSRGLRIVRSNGCLFGAIE